MLAPTSGARLIHSPRGAASSVTMIAAAVTIRTTRTSAVSQGETPCCFPHFVIGASVMAMSAAAITGSRIGREASRQAIKIRMKMPIVAICAAVPQKSAALAGGCGSLISGTKRFTRRARIELHGHLLPRPDRKIEPMGSRVDWSIVCRCALGTQQRGADRGSSFRSPRASARHV